MHVLIDGKAHSKPNVDLVRNVVSVIPELIGMVKVGEPVVTKEKDEIVGIQVIAESHVSMTAKGNNVWIDIFSCKAFDINDKALPYLVKLFKFGDNYTVQTLERGLEFIAIGDGWLQKKPPEGANPVKLRGKGVDPMESHTQAKKRGV